MAVSAIYIPPSSSLSLSLSPYIFISPSPLSSRVLSPMLI